MSALISIYSNIRHITDPKEIPLDIFLENIRTGVWQDLVLPIRTIQDKEARQEAKKKLPNVNISGTFRARLDNDIIKHSGFVGIDIDDVNPEEVKNTLKNDRFVYAAFTSVSGRGVCVLFKINPEKHRETFPAIGAYLYNTYGQICTHDKTSINPSRARFVSYDPHIIINQDAAKFTNFIVDKPPKKIEKIVYAANDFEDILKELQRRGINLAENYYEWLRIGFGIADKFGESGRSYFHIISQYSGKYNVNACNKQYDACLKGRNEGSTIATVYYYAKEAGIPIYSEQTKLIAHTAANAKKGGVSIETAVKNLQKFEDIPAEISLPIVQQVYDNNISISTDDSVINQIENWIRHSYDLRRNIITLQIENGDKIMRNKELNTMYVAAKKVFDKDLNFELLERIIDSDFTPDYNPLLDFIERNKDSFRAGKIKKLFSTIKSDNDAFLNYFGTKWLVGIIASIHGEHSPLLLALTGGMNVGKTEWFRRLLPDELKRYYGESKLDAGKDDEILMTQKLLLMDDELGGKTQMERKRLNELTSKDIFSLRPPFGRQNVDIKRLAVLCGTSNERGLLNDPFGNRRIIPVLVLDIDHALFNSIDKTEVLMEAYALYKSGWNWRLTPEDIKNLQLATREFVNYTLEYEMIVKYFKKPTNLETCEYMMTTEIKNELEQKTMQKLSLHKLGSELQAMGFVQKSVKKDGLSRKMYAVERVAQSLFPITSSF